MQQDVVEPQGAGAPHVGGCIPHGLGRHAQGEAVARLGQLHIQRPPATLFQPRGFPRGGVPRGGRRTGIRQAVQQGDRLAPRRNGVVALEALRHGRDGRFHVEAVEHAAGARLAGSGRALRRGEQFRGAGAVAAVGRNHGATEQGAHQFQVEFESVGGGLVAHVQRENERHAHFRQLRGQMQVALQVRRVDHLDHDAGTLRQDFVAGDGFLGRSGQEAVDAGQIHHFDRAAGARETGGLLFDGHAGIVAHVLVGAGDPIEQARLAAVRVARQQDHQIGWHVRVHGASFRSGPAAI